MFDASTKPVLLYISEIWADFNKIYVKQIFKKDYGIVMKYLRECTEKFVNMADSAAFWVKGMFSSTFGLYIGC